MSSYQKEEKASLYEKISQLRKGTTQYESTSLNSIPINRTSSLTKPNEKQATISVRHNEFGGWAGGLFLIITFPLSLLYFFLSCTKEVCEFTQFYPQNLDNLFSMFYSLETYLIFCAYIVYVALLSFLPWGNVTYTYLPQAKGKPFIYVANGIFVMIFVIGLIVVLDITDYFPVSQFIVRHFYAYFMASLIGGATMLIYTYIRSFFVPIEHLNLFVLNESLIYAFFMGREIRPRLFGRLDLKFYMLKLTLIGAMILDFAFLHQHITFALQNGISNAINLTLILQAILHTIYFVDGLAFEYTWTTSFEIVQEGFGFSFSIGYFLYPFMAAASTKYILDFDLHLPTWRLILSLLIFMFGYTIFRGSNNQKDAFRTNPRHPKFKNFRTIATGQKKSLLCSGYWGFVRHPNYLGDILIQLSFASFVPTVPPVLMLLPLVVLLIHRSRRDHYRCKMRYGSAWDSYCNTVKYVLIPGIY